MQTEDFQLRAKDLKPKTKDLQKNRHKDKKLTYKHNKLTDPQQDTKYSYPKTRSLHLEGKYIKKQLTFKHIRPTF